MLKRGLEFGNRVLGESSTTSTQSMQCEIYYSVCNPALADLRLSQKSVNHKSGGFHTGQSYILWPNFSQIFYSTPLYP